jgi:hypothetical protein
MVGNGHVRIGAHLRHAREASRQSRPMSRPSLDGLPKSAAVVDTLITPPHERRVTVLETTVAPGSSAGDALYTLPDPQKEAS